MVKLRIDGDGDGDGANIYYFIKKRRRVVDHASFRLLSSPLLSFPSPFIVSFSSSSNFLTRLELRSPHPPASIYLNSWYLNKWPKFPNILEITKISLY